MAIEIENDLNHDFNQLVCDFDFNLNQFLVIFFGVIL
jgi:hypothetical protein